MCIPAALSAFCGVTEPAIYGITLPKKKPFYITCILSGIGGTIIAMLGMRQYSVGAMGCFAWPTFIGDSTSPMITMIMITMVSMIAAFAVVYVTY